MITEARLLEGKKIAEKLKSELKGVIEGLGNIKPSLLAIQIGTDPASLQYMNAQRVAAEQIGAKHEVRLLPGASTEEDLIQAIEQANRDKNIHGIIVQMPLPKTFQVDRILDTIHPDKDVEAVTMRNLGRLGVNKTGLAPCTARACLRLIEETGVDVFGKEAVIIGSSKTVGLPAFLLCVGKKLTSTVCHTGTFKAGMLEFHVRRADVLIVSAGKPKMVPGEWIKPGAIVIDVGINRVDGKTVGDVDFEVAKTKAAFITPVPGGVGPLTTVMLLENLVAAFKAQNGI